MLCLCAVCVKPCVWSGVLCVWLPMLCLCAVWLRLCEWSGVLCLCWFIVCLCAFCDKLCLCPENVLDDGPPVLMVIVLVPIVLVVHPVLEPPPLSTEILALASPVSPLAPPLVPPPPLSGP